MAFACIALYVLDFFGVDTWELFAVSPLTVAEKPWTLVSAMFVHGSWWHLLANLYSLALLGILMETSFGSLRFGAIYFLSGIMGNISFCLFSSGLSGGASGAILGLMGAEVVMALLNNDEFGSYGIGDKTVVFLDPKTLGSLLVLNFIVSFFPGVALWAHFGGFVAGVVAALVILVLSKRTRRMNYSDYLLFK